jgi:outer membrane lipase/esterase
LDALLVRSPKLASDGLYAVWAGANDILNSVQIQGPALADPVRQMTAVQQVLADTSGAARATVGLIDKMHDAGAGTVMVLNLPDIGATPQGRAAGPAQALLSGATTQFNTLLNTQLATRTRDIAMLDVHSLFNEVMAAPEQYGLVRPAFSTTGASPVTSISGLRISNSVAAPKARCPP